MSDLHILVVDDGQNWREELPQILQRLGGIVYVDAASSYADALHYVRKEKYDLITVDIALSGDPSDPRNADQSGMELLQVIRDNQYNKDCGLIVLTAYGNVPRTNQARRDYDVYDFIEKDKFDAQHFVETARAAIRNARLSRAEAKARARLRLIITFSQEYLVSSELTAPNRQAVYAATDPIRFKVADLARRADDLNLRLLNEKAGTWRPEVQSIGKDIYDALSREQRIQNDLIAAQALTQHPSDLWLQFSGPAIGLGIPFELLHNGDDYLGCTHILTRRLVLTGPTLRRKTVPFHTFLAELLKRQEMLRILVVGANCDGNIPAAEIEATSLKTAIESDLRQLGIACEITVLSGAEANHAKVSKALRAGRYHIFHYAGHGRYNDTLPEISGLILHDDNKPRILTAADLNMLVRNTELHLVFLSCCLGARNASQVGRGDFHSVLEAVASADIPTVLGYRWTVADKPAMRLAEAFYETLWRTFSPAEALLEARVRATLGPKGRDDETWASPVLVMQNG